ncbi:MAG TPA: LptF/LptG family permease, partial [Chitinophagales bacterium]|nr:LptF/LptG family permease [Chitinophagales bacterium]
AVFSGFFYVANNYMVPYSNKKRIEFEDKYVSKPPVGIRFNFHRTVAPGVIIYFENYRPSDGTAGRFSIDKFEGGKLVYKLRAEKVMWNKTTHKWHISNYYTRTLHNNGDVITTGASMDSAFTFKPDDFTFGESKKETMTTPQLAQYIDYMRKGGQQDIEFYEVERYRRTSSAFSVFIMTLIGVSLASRKVRGGVGWHFVLGIGLCALYEVIMKFTITFSTNASLPPLLGVWIPNFMYGALAIYLLKRAPK